MPSTPPAGDDDTAVLAGLVAWLDEKSSPGSHMIVGHEAPAAGYSSKTLLVDVDRTERVGRTHRERVVLKLPPSGPAIFDRYDFEMQAKVQEAVAAAGIPAASPVRAESDTRWMGVPFLVMPLVDGQIFGQAPAFDKRLTTADPDTNTAFHGGFIDLLADINRVDWAAAALGAVVPQRDVAAELAYWRAYLAWYGDGVELVPTLTSALDWCEVNRPAEEPAPGLLWGDVRIENVIVDADRNVLAVLDWEMATIGAPEHDLAWVLTLDATMETLSGRTVPGFLDRAGCIARYEKRLGRSVHDFEWYEIFAMVRSSAIMSRIAHLNERRGESNFYPVSDNPILDLITRRIDHASRSH